MKVKGKLKVLYDFTGNDSNQLTLKAGDVILWNDGCLSDEWILCSYQQKSGWVPGSYVRLEENSPRPLSVSSCRSSIGLRDSMDSRKSLRQSMENRFSCSLDNDDYIALLHLGINSNLRYVDESIFVEIIEPNSIFRKGEIVQVAGYNSDMIILYKDHGLHEVPSSFCVTAVGSGTPVSVSELQLLMKTQYPSAKRLSDTLLRDSLSTGSQQENLTYRLRCGFDKGSFSCTPTSESSFVKSQYSLSHW